MVPFKDDLHGYKPKKDDTKAAVVADMDDGKKFNDVITKIGRGKHQVDGSDGVLVVGFTQLLAGDKRAGTMFKYSFTLPSNGRVSKATKNAIPFTGWLAVFEPELSSALDSYEAHMRTNPGFAQAVQAIKVDDVIDYHLHIDDPADPDGGKIDNPGIPRCWALLDQCPEGAAKLRAMLSALRSDTVAAPNQAPVAIGQQMPVVSLTMPATSQTYVDFATGDHGRLHHFDAASNQPVKKEELTTASPDFPIPAGREFDLYPTLKANLNNFWFLTFEDQLSKVKGSKDKTDVERSKRYANDWKSRVKCAFRCRIHQIEDKSERLPGNEVALFRTTTDEQFCKAMEKCGYKNFRDVPIALRAYRVMLTELDQARTTIKAERKALHK